MSLKVREFNPEKDYSTVIEWWEAQEWPALPLEMLPKNGFIVEDEEEKVAASWVYRTDSRIYIMEWTVGNPVLDHKKRGEGLDILLDVCSQWAKSQGAWMLLSMTSHDRLIDRLETKDFKKTDENMTHLMRRL